MLILDHQSLHITSTNTTRIKCS